MHDDEEPGPSAADDAGGFDLEPIATRPLVDEPPQNHPDESPDVEHDVDDRFGERIVTASVVTACCLFVFWQLQPDLIFRDTTPTGGDMGAHVWGPAFLRDELLPRFRLTGWTPDWYSGFPAFHFYMVLPALAIVVLDVGLHPILSVPAVLGLAAVVARFWTADHLRRFAPLVTALAIVGAALVVSLPYNVAFKIVAVSGVVLFPAGAWALGHFGGLRYPGPAVLSVASLAFAFDRSFNIYGGNIASTLAGEFAASISLTLSLVALGLVIRGTRTGEYRVSAGIAIALTALCHLLPAFFLLAAVVVLMLGRLGVLIRNAIGGRDWRAQFAALPWMIGSGGLAMLLSAFWVFPFWARTDYLNDMGWERIEIIHSPLVTRSRLNPADVLSDYPPLPVLLVLAVVGVLLSIRHRVMLGWVLTATGLVMAAGFVWFPDGRLWNARILPFYYLCVGLLAGLAVALSARSLVRAHISTRLALLIFGVSVLLVPGLRSDRVWPEPGDEGSYWVDAGAYTLRTLAIFAVLLFAFTEVPRQLTRLMPRGFVTAVVVALGVLIVSPGRDIQTSQFRDADGGLSVSGVLFSSAMFWLIAMFLAIAAILFAGERAVRRLRRWSAADDARRFPRTDDRVVLRVAPLGAMLVVFVLLGLALRTTGGIEERDDGVAAWSFAGIEVASADRSFVPGWATWNFEGLEGKNRNDGANGDVGQGGWLEYQYVQRTMAGVGEQVGCGRAMWEFAPELNRYGTTMAMMLLPMWTDGCIGSMEGLYFEATPTVPYHFLLQSDLSAPSRSLGEAGSVGGPSRAMRDLPYDSFDIDRGVDRLHELGVRYYLAFSPQSIAAAREHPDLTEVTSAAPWVVFETQAELVSPLDAVPVVVDGVRDHQDQWLDLGVEWFTTGAASSPRPASSGPADWQRVDAAEVVDRYEAEGTRLAGSIPAEAPDLATLLAGSPAPAPVEVSDVETDTDRISFRVDRVGEPVLVRTSYFPNWRVDGAEGPWRVAPNFMVVVPTSEEVELVFGRTGVDWAAIAMTAIGLLGVLAVGVRRRDGGGADDLTDQGEGDGLDAEQTSPETTAFDPDAELAPSS